jgi:hypothetical protein
MRISLSPNHVLAATFTVVAVGLSLFVLSGGAGSLPATQDVPAAVVAVGRIDSAVAAPRPSRPAPARHARATALVVRSAPRLRPAARHAVRPPRSPVTRRASPPVAKATPRSVVPAAPVVAKPTVGKHEERHKFKQSHKKAKPPRGPGEKPGRHGKHGGGHGNHAGGHGNHGGGLGNQDGGHGNQDGGRGHQGGR